ncbi:tetratricopeptide repeat protein [Kroppenstedtia eburnea]|uniref:Tetratricopeptide repeat-containing protein n=1 Tax=Kroppenstedtia eburnea TaxID=714067 RepID=A0A1N7JXA5_9BACL|nr:tetratricopeptide repeat protein [Kroppenstedtia eburnea]QKI83402.1 tetratricopeptide repeat protein [Kroppenstedtia eburnea]SIS53876.1 Tetratricopeptide repeat-containing protein [Kroppenstedtia eburnea]
MKKQHADACSKGHKVVRLRLDAGFFFERAVRSLDRHRYDKALKYFRLAVEKEPDNPVNQCNLAGILSEMGCFDESNEVLEKVLTEVDPDLSECWFYMANNAANMDEFELAEEYLIRYLEEEREGEFAAEAEDMLEMLAYELGRQPRQPKARPKQDWMKKHDEARECLESGRFLQAMEILEELLEEHPDFHAVMNNLSLAYYYTGDVDQAVETIERVLVSDPGNLHALCNLAVFFQHLKERKSRDRLVGILKKWIPFHPEHMYKLATTLGILGEHEDAFAMFRRLIKREERPEASLYHYAAVAAFNTKSFARARKYWQLARELDPDSKIPVFYLNQLEQWESLPPEQVPPVSYHYQLPFEEQLMQLDRERSTIPEQIRQNPLIRSSFFWALNHGDKETKLQVLQVFEWLGDKEVEQVLRSFLLKRDEEDDLKRLALYILKKIGAAEPYRVVLGSREMTIHPYELAQELPGWLKTWEQVLQCCLEAMKGRYDTAHLNDAQLIWSEFLREHRADFPEIRKVEGWAAALEYIVARLHGSSLTQESVAKRHAVSASTVGRNVRCLEKVCRVNKGFEPHT